MTKLLTTLFALTVACVTVSAQAQTAAPAAPAAATAAAAPAPSTPKSLDAKAAMCVGCHAIKGYHATFPEVYRVPMIAGQNAKYIASALAAYKNGDRKHPTMRAVAASLTEQDIADLSAYYEREGKADQKTLADKPSVEPNAQVAGLMKKAACVSCHGNNFSKPIDPSYPKIAGQHSDYLFVALKSYKVEGNRQVGRANGVMGAIAKQFTNAELKELAAYVGSLDSELVTKPQSRLR